MKQLQLYNCGPAEVGNVIGFAPLFLLEDCNYFKDTLYNQGLYDQF